MSHRELAEVRSSALARPPFRRHPAFLLPGRGRGDRHLADRGCSGSRPRRPPLSRPPCGGERAVEPGPRPARPQARDRRRQDHGHGHAHCMADGQRGAPPRQPPIHARLPRDDPRPHHPGSAPGAPAERPRQLLPEPRAGSGGHARRSRPREDHHHQLPRLHAARDPRDLERRTFTPAGSRPGDLDARNRGPDAPAGHAGPHGDEEHPGPQRRGAPLLPGEAARRG